MKKNIVIILFFAAYLILGLSIYKDYGACWDEIYQRDFGIKAYNYIVYGDNEYLTIINRFYGPVFQLLAVQMEKTFHPQNLQDIYFLRHLLVFLVFYAGLIFFYLFLSKRFRDWRLALLGCFFMVLSPRLFGHTFYNPKDIPFLALFILCAYSFVLVLEKMTIPRILLLAVSTALAISMRILGVFVPAFVIFCAILYKFTDAKQKTSSNTRFFILLAAYVIFLTPLVVIFWPILWEAPLPRFMEALSNLKALDWHKIPTLYMGRKILPSDVPWHYTPFWMLITIPVTYTVLFIAGIFVFLRNLLGRAIGRQKEFIIDVFCFLWVFVPLVLPMFFHSPRFSSWRHHYFIYPAFLAIALSGLSALRERIVAVNNLTKKKIILVAISLLIALDLGSVAGFMIRNHPYEDVYFNRLIGGIKGAEGKFEMDYWGISYRRAFEYIAKTDKTPYIDILAGNYSAKCNLFIVPFDVSTRFNVIVAATDPLTPKYTFHSGNAWLAKDAKYYVTDFYGTYDRLPFPLYYTVKVDGVSILDVYSAE